MPEKNETLFRVLQWVVGLILVGLCIDALQFKVLEDAASHRVMHGILVFSLAIALVMLQIVRGTMRQKEASIDSRKKMEMRRAADNTALRYKNLLECAGDAIFVIDAGTGQLNEMNSRGTELFGFSREEMGNLVARELIPVHDQAIFIALVRRVTVQGLAGDACINFKRKDGSRFLGEVNARLVDLGDEKVVLAIIRDISQKKEAELEIRKRNRKLSILNSVIARANQSLHLNAVLDATLQETMELFGAEGGAIHFVEDGAKALTLVAQKNFPSHLIPTTGDDDPVLGHLCRMEANRQCIDLLQGSGAGCAVAAVAREGGWQSVAGIPLFAGRRLIGTMHILTHAERAYTPDDVNFFTTMGNQIGIVIEHARLFEELNWKSEELLRSHRLLEKSSRQLALSQERLKNNLALVEQANTELERLDRVKNQFIGMISHEFRTPLTSILSGAEFLLARHETAWDDEQRRVLQMIHTGGARLNEIVMDLLKVARLEVNTPAAAKTPLRLAEILEVLLEQFAPVLQERGQRFILRGMENLPSFNGDREYLEEIFTRLLENAVKFTPDAGEICIAARVTDRTMLEEKEGVVCRFNRRFYEQMGCKCYLQVEVRDSGIGIDAAEQPKIFDKFYEIGDIRHHSTGKHKFQGKGTGLGLAIVKGMIEAHGGMVWVESPAAEAPGRSGSVFFLLLPLEEGSSQAVFPFIQGSVLPPS